MLVLVLNDYRLLNNITANGLGQELILTGELCCPVDFLFLHSDCLQQEEQDHGEAVLPGGIREYVNAYKSFSEDFTSMLKLVIADELTQEIVAEIQSMIKSLKIQITV